MSCSNSGIRGYYPLNQIKFGLSIKELFLCQGSVILGLCLCHGLPCCEPALGWHAWHPQDGPWFRITAILFIFRQAAAMVTLYDFLGYLFFNVRVWSLGEISYYCVKMDIWIPSWHKGWYSMLNDPRILF